MRIKRTCIKHKKLDRRAWHPHFLWFPKYLPYDGVIVFLETVERRDISPLCAKDRFNYVYRVIS